MAARGGTRTERRPSGHPGSAPARPALRETIEALVDRRPVPPAAVSDLNFFLQSAPVSTRLLMTGTGLRAQTQWHGEHGGNPRLAFIAARAAESLSDPSKVSRLRR